MFNWRKAGMAVATVCLVAIAAAPTWGDPGENRGQGRDRGRGNNGRPPVIEGIEDLDVEVDVDIEVPCSGDVCDGDETPEPSAGEAVVTLTNGYRVTFVGVSYTQTTSTWRYYVEELPVAQDLSNWVLALPLACARVVGASPRGELVNPDPNARLVGIKWQPGGGFVAGEFAVTLSGAIGLGRIDVAVKGPDVAIGQINGPVCR